MNEVVAGWVYSSRDRSFLPFPIWWPCIFSYLQGWGLLSPFLLFHYFPNFSASLNYMLAIEYHIHIWQVSPQLSCGDTCQIWMWCKNSKKYFSRIENFAYGEINERSFSNPHPSSVNRWQLFIRSQPQLHSGGYDSLHLSSIQYHLILDGPGIINWLYLCCSELG